MAVDALQLHLLADGLVIPAAQLRLAGPFINQHLPPQGTEDGDIGEGHQNHHQQDAKKPRQVRHGGVHRHRSDHNEQIVHRADDGKGPPSPQQAGLQLQKGPAQVPPYEQLRRRENHQPTQQQDDVGIPGETVQEVGELQKPEAESIRDAKKEKEPPVPVFGKDIEQRQGGQGAGEKGDAHNDAVAQPVHGQHIADKERPRPGKADKQRPAPGVPGDEKEQENY